MGIIMYKVYKCCKEKFAIWSQGFAKGLLRPKLWATVTNCLWVGSRTQFVGTCYGNVAVATFHGSSSRLGGLQNVASRPRLVHNIPLLKHSVHTCTCTCTCTYLPPPTLPSPSAHDETPATIPSQHCDVGKTTWPAVHVHVHTAV